MSGIADLALAGGTEGTAAGAAALGFSPLTLFALGSTGLTALSQLGGGYVGSSIDQLQQSIANMNTQLLVSKAKMEAESGQLALSEGGLEQARTASTIQRTLGGETGHFAAANLDPTTGSPLLLEGFSAGQGATDLALIAARAQMGEAQALGAAAGTMAQAAGSAGQAAAFGMKSTQDIMAGYFGAASSIFSQLNNAKMWGPLSAAATSIGQGFQNIGQMFMPSPSPYNQTGSLY